MITNTVRLLPAFILFAAVPAQVESDAFAAFAKKVAGRQTFGIYIVGAKVGWGSLEIKVVDLGKRRALEEKMSMDISIAALGEASNMRGVQLRQFDLQTGDLIFVRDSMLEDKTRTIRTARRIGDKLEVHSKVNDTETTRTAKMPDISLRGYLKLDAWLKGEREEGDRYEFDYLDLEQRSCAVKMKFVFEETTRVRINGVPTKVHLLEASMMGARGSAEYLDSIRFLKMRMGGILEMRMEEEAIAKQRGAKVPDLLLRSSLKLDKNLGDTSKLDRIVLEVSGLAKDPLLKSHRQKVISRDDGKAVVELLRGGNAPESKLSEEDRENYVRESPAIQSNHPRILTLAKKVTGDVATPRAKVERIIKWLEANIEGHYARNAPTALQVLDNMAGDCSEFTLLFVALSRASGIPAREVSGLVAFTEDQSMFGGHAWAEYYDGKRWSIVDPSWGETAVHAGHFRLGVGPNDLRMANFIGRMKLRVRSFESRK